MLSAGMPELRDEGDIVWLVESLQLLKSEKEAAEYFKAKIEESYYTYYRRVDNFFHNIK